MYKCIIWSNSSKGREYDVNTKSAYKAAKKLGRCEGGEAEYVTNKRVAKGEIEMFTIGELKERFEGQYDSIEVYFMNGRTFHTDSIRLAAEDEYTDITECVDFELMDKERYFRTIEANTSLMPDNVEDEQFPILVIGIK